MIIKSFELKKLITNNHKMILLYGKNEGFKNEAINLILKPKENISKYDEKEILDNPEIIFNTILSKSLFEKDKSIIIKGGTDKILKIIEEINEKKIEDVTIIINSGNLEKKSKLRSFFEKSKVHICIAFYPDDTQTLIKLTQTFLREKKISLSPSNINLIIEKCNEDRGNLVNQLKKIEYYNKNGKKIDTTIIKKLVNLSENHSVIELIDNCLAKNKNKLITILNENNFTKEDCITITRALLNKSKKILKLTKEYEINNNINLTISSAKPPIFWKDKEITKQQIYKWSPKNISQLIYKLSELELIIKKNFENSVNIITDFLLEQSSSKTNN